MRGIAYAIAAIAAVGIMIGITSMQPSDQQPGEGAASQGTTTAVADTVVTSEPGELVFSVPEMHCEFSCFPRVKELIEGSDGVQAVELAEQKEEGVIDNRQVIVKHDAGFDVSGTLALLAKEGFEDSDVVQ